jgi:hypothetical protein
MLLTTMLPNPWAAYVRRCERAAAAEMADVKTVRRAGVGFNIVDPEGRPDDLDGLLSYARAALDDPDNAMWPRDIEFARDGDLVTFESFGDWQDVGQARLYPAHDHRRAVVLLPFWNARREDVAPFGKALAACGITCLQLSLPCHDERQTPGMGFAREMACENLGMTLAANMQAVREARAGLSFLESSGYRSLGIVGISMGASLASIAATIDRRVRAAALLLMADDFAEVVWTGAATRHVRQSLERYFGLDTVREAWSPISPASYAAQFACRLDEVLIVSGALDEVFQPELTERYIKRLRRAGGRPIWARYGCGHYTLARFPYSLRMLWRTVAYLRAQL